ncbi:PIG-L deacetylase family protein [Neisseria weaveri]|nr:PIG-L family deacetylase [Neisseria weaveri]
MEVLLWLLAFACIAVAGGLAFFYFFYPRLFAYDVRRNYNFEVTPTCFVEVSEGRLILPGDIEPGSTVLLEVNVYSTLKGHYRMPYVSIETSEGVRKQYLEYGVKGLRYLNLSHTFSMTGEEIKLSGSGVSIPNQTCGLIVYPAEDLGNKKVLIIAPHPDDAEIAAYGIYSQQTDKAFVVTVTAGENGAFSYSNLYNPNNPEEFHKHYLQKGRIRVWNSLAVPLLGGVPSEQILQLGFFDSTLEAMKQNPEQNIPSMKLDTADIEVFRSGNTSEFAKGLTGGSNWNSLVDNMAYIVDRFQPDIVIAPAPNIDTHPDHQFSTIAVLEAMKKLDYRKGSLFLHTVHHIYDDYPLGKVGSVLSLPPKFEQPFYFKSIYSHPLSADDVKDKLLALDAMNDIRPNTDGYSSWRVMLFRGLNGLRHAVFNFERDLINRFTRSNELFYVVPVSEIYQDEIYQKITHRARSVK